MVTIPHRTHFFTTIAFIHSFLHSPEESNLRVFFCTMVKFASTVSTALAVSSLLGFAVAHPGEKHDHAKIKRQIDARGLRAAAAKRSLSACENSNKHRSLMERSVARRARTLNRLREKRGTNVSESRLVTFHRSDVITNRPLDSRKFRRDLADLQEFEAVNQ